MVASFLKRLLNKTNDLIFCPEPLRVVFFRFLLTKLTFIPYSTRLYKEAVPRPWYGFPIFNSLKLAKALGYKKVSIIEFGVAGGSGLVNIEYHVKEIQKIIDIEVEIYGFDSGVGLPKLEDYRDLPYFWKEGFYKMDVPKIKSRLNSAKLVLGDVKETLKNFECAPIACVMIDLDYYSSTVAALDIFNKPHLPRVFCYFDDVAPISGEVCLYSEYTGELLAINEYNNKNTAKKITKYIGKNTKYRNNMYIFNNFEHQKYGVYVNSENGLGCDLV